MLRKIRELEDFWHSMPKHRKFRVYSMLGIFMVLGFEHTVLAWLATLGWTIHGTFWLMSED